MNATIKPSQVVQEYRRSPARWGKPLEINGLRRCPRCRSFDITERCEFGGSRSRHTIMCHVCKVESDVTGATR